MYNSMVRNPEIHQGTIYKKYELELSCKRDGGYSEFERERERDRYSLKHDSAQIDPVSGYIERLGRENIRINGCP